MAVKPKQVVIVEHGTTIFVEYVARKKHQKYYAGMFDNRVVNMAYVEKWVAGNDKLLLTKGTENV